ncbi:hypothetical protein BUALT_Bualt06G0101300 [Buddleja alternifolia]|uniref:Uncharacterized protein n=1 Tax=Buddleja alternifolia TaxID=168488 RepID=A0AAV6XFG0_9LAMI|nr:hypothetical protein BUALT_Bualt06G0101300 [Buddleja alternifolia]
MEDTIILYASPEHLNSMLKSKIKAFVIDFFCNPAFEVSRSLNIPTYFYVSSGGFGLCAFIYFPTIDETIDPKNIGDMNDFLEIPGCPLLCSLDFPRGMFFRQSNTYKHFLDTAKNMRKSNGIVVNAFNALEFRAKEALSNAFNALVESGADKTRISV